MKIVRIVVVGIAMYLATNSAQAALTQEQAEDKILSLVHQVLKPDNKTLSWKCFCQKTTEYLAGITKYTKLRESFTKLENETNTVTIGLTLSGYASTDILPKKIKDALGKVDIVTKKARIEAAIKLNSKFKDCKEHKHIEL